MDKYRNAAALLLAVAAFAFGGCGGTAGNNGQLPLAGVVLQKSQQGQSGGPIDFDGDGIDDLVVGAPYATSGVKVGAVLVYKGSANGFTAKPTWVLTGGDNFGCSSARLGTDFAIGAYNGSATDVSLSGSVTIYKGNGSGAVIAKLAGDDALDKFGFSIAGGDVNHDGYHDIVIAAPYHSPSPDLYQKGAAYLYFGPDFKEATRVKLPATSTHAFNLLGATVAFGDLNGDGMDDLIIGAAGEVLVYYGGHHSFTPSTDSPDVTVKSGDRQFGTSLTVLNDLNGDGFKELVIGAPQATVSGSNRVGRVYIVKGGSGPRSINLASPGTDLLTRIDGAAYFDYFGSAVSPAGDLDGDGKPELVVSAINADKPGATSRATGLTNGRVYLFKSSKIKSAGAATPVADAVVFDGPGFDMHFGASLAPLDNGAKLLVGAPTENRQTGGLYTIDLKTGAISDSGSGAGTKSAMKGGN